MVQILIWSRVEKVRLHREWSATRSRVHESDSAHSEWETIDSNSESITLQKFLTERNDRVAFGIDSDLCDSRDSNVAIDGAAKLNFDLLTGELLFEIDDEIWAGLEIRSDDSIELPCLEGEASAFDQTDLLTRSEIGVGDLAQCARVEGEESTGIDEETGPLHLR